jgi:hypothetical protein
MLHWLHLLAYTSYTCTQPQMSSTHPLKQLSIDILCTAKLACPSLRLCAR